MDDKTSRLVNQLKGNPAMLRALMQSQDGQALMQMAVQSAAKGRPEEMVKMVNQVMQSPEGADLVERINKAVQK